MIGRPKRVIRRGLLCEAVLIVGCRGVQVGDHNEQYNQYTYRLRTPHLDFAPVLRRPDVRERLAALALDPENQDKRAAVMEALGARTWSVRRDAVQLRAVRREDGSRSVPRASSVPPPVRAGRGQSFVFIRHCRGVQVGQRLRQYNDFAYVCPRPRVDERQLLRESPGLMDALVDVVTGRAAAAALTDEIHRAFDAASFAPPPHPPSRSGTLQGYDGVTVGRDSRAIDESRLTAEVNGRKLVRDLGREAGVVARRRRTLEQDRLRAEERARDAQRARDQALARDVAQARAAARRDAERLGRRSRRTPGRGGGL
ncbi:RIP homotypic interaction motif-containing protein [Streptomyces scabiei]|uniref:RIP homotypic interaction motif-containing protein n=1 Tax=Streptomyces scabiei TaxID=1930 RepID=UPI0038F671D7